MESSDYALYRSDDGGQTFSLRSKDSDVGNRPFYYAEIHADPTNEDHVFSLWSMVSKSTDGGRTFEVILPYSGVHPDHHALYIHPTDPNYLINGNDGGLNFSRDGGDNWTFVNNLPVGQFYHIAVDNAEPYNVYGGMQDNGSWVARPPCGTPEAFATRIGKRSCLGTVSTCSPRATATCTPCTREVL